MPATTNIYAYYMPTVGGDAGAWGGYLNTNFELLDTWLTNTFDTPSTHPSTGHLGTIKDSRLPSSQAGKTFTSAVSLSGSGSKVSFGARVAASNTDLSEHLELHTNGYGMSVQAARLNLIAVSGATVRTVFGGTDGPQISVTQYLAKDTGIAYSFEGDTNTGMGREAENSLGFYVNGTMRLRLNTTGFRSTLGMTLNTDFSDFDAGQDKSETAITANGQILLHTESEATATTSFLSGTYGTTNTFQIRRNGNMLNANGSYGTISDRLVKANIANATSKAAALRKLRVVNYTLKGMMAREGKLIGLIADECEQVFPSLVEVDPETGLKSIKTSVFIYILIKAFQEQADEIDALHQLVQRLSDKVNQ